MDEFYKKLQESVLDGDEELGVQLTREQMDAGVDPIDIVQKVLVPILDDIGERFSRLEIYLPDLVMSADVAKAIKDEIQGGLSANAEGGKTKGKIVIGTVQGDVHDIGKNIVSTLLEVNGFEVYDLGNDVSPQSFIETAQRERVDIIALSSLLTTSMPFMNDLLKSLNGLGIRDKYKVVVGGGPVSQEWADNIGADGYSKDANEAVELCTRMMKEKVGA